MSKIMTNDDNNILIKLINFSCEKCAFKCCNKQDYNRHLSTRKHIMMTNNDIKYSKEHVCSCGKKYKHRQGLSVHKKTCNYTEHLEQLKHVEKETNVNSCYDDTSSFHIDKELLIKTRIKLIK